MFDPWYFTSHLDEPHYYNFNADAVASGRTPVNFGEKNKEADEYCEKAIHGDVYEKEARDMMFEKWVRELDDESFLYVNYLNPKGLISKVRNCVREDREE